MVSAELDRILALPRLGEITEEWAAEVTAARCPPGAIYPGGVFQGLNCQQALALETCEMYGAGFVMSGVGTGKTTIAYGCADIAMRVLQHQKVLILMPNNTVRQFTSQGRREAQEWLGVKQPVHNMHGMPRATRAALVRLDRPGMYIMPYSLLSQPDTESILRGIGPTTIICDEAHRLRNIKAAGTRRLFNYIKTLPLESRIVILLSGTMTRAGIKDYYHLAGLALGGMSPLPLSYMEAERWGNAIDARGSSFMPLVYGGLGDGSVMAELQPLVDWADDAGVDLGQDPYTRLRRAFGERLTSCHGVVSSPEGEMPCPLEIDLAATELPGDTVRKNLYNIQTLGVTPTGDIIEYGLHRYKWMFESAAGFYNHLRWPSDAELEKQGKSTSDLDRSLNHHAALQSYHKELRVYLDGRPYEGLDTPMLVGQHFAQKHGRGELDGVLYALWRDAKDLAAFPGLVERVSEPVRVDPYKINAMLKWAETAPSGLVWVYHNEMRAWAVEALRNAGHDVVDCPSGSKTANVALGAEAALKRKGVKPTFYVLSYNGWREGLNLQWSAHCFYLQWPIAEDVVEQSIGRQHRQGQQSEEVSVTVPICPSMEHDGEPIDFDSTLFCASLVRSLYVQQSTRTSRRLMVASYPTAPKVYPMEMLSERFPGARGLGRQVAEELFKKFHG